MVVIAGLLIVLGDPADARSTSQTSAPFRLISEHARSVTLATPGICDQRLSWPACDLGNESQPSVASSWSSSSASSGTDCGETTEETRWSNPGTPARLATSSRTSMLT